MSKVIKISKADMEKMLSGLHDCENCEEKECAVRSKAFVKQVKPSESDLEIIKDAINSRAAYRAPVRLMGQNELFLENLKEGMEYKFHYLVHGASHAKAHLDEIQTILARIIVAFTQIEPKLSPDGRMYVDHLVNLGIIYTNSIQDALVKLAEIEGMEQYESESSILNEKIKDISASLSFSPNKEMLASLRTSTQYVFNPDYPKDVSGYRTYMADMFRECDLVITALRATYGAYQVSEGAQTHLKAIIEKAGVYRDSIAHAIGKTLTDFKPNPIPGENKMTAEDTLLINGCITSLIPGCDCLSTVQFLTNTMEGKHSDYEFIVDPIIRTGFYNGEGLVFTANEVLKDFNTVFEKLSKGLDGLSLSEEGKSQVAKVKEMAMRYGHSIQKMLAIINRANLAKPSQPSIYGTDTPAIQAIISNLVAKAEYEPNRDMLTSLLSGNGSKLVDASIAEHDLHYLMGMFSEFRKLFGKLFKKLSKVLLKTAAESDNLDAVMRLAEAYGDSLAAAIDKLTNSGSHPDFGRNLADMIVGEKAPKATNIVVVGDHRTPYIASSDAPTKEQHLQSLKSGYNSIVQAMNEVNLKHPNNVAFSNTMLKNIMDAITVISPEDMMPLVAVDECGEFESLFNGIVPALDIVAQCKPVSELFQSEFHKAKEHLDKLSTAKNRATELSKMIDACSEEELLNAAKRIENRRKTVKK